MHAAVKFFSIAAAAAAFSLAAAPSHADAGHHHATAHGADEEAFGREGDPKLVTRTITVEMSDAMRFTPASIDVKRGETVRIVALNQGKMAHELVLGTLAQLKAHGEAMRKNPEMEHADPYMLSVKPGEKKDMVWQFSQAGAFDFACLLPGHMEAGMVGKIAVKQ